MPTGHYKRKPRVGRIAISCCVCGSKKMVLPSFAARVTGNYCSQACAGKASRSVPEKACEQCRTVFKPRRKTTRYCSNACRSKARRVEHAKWNDREYRRDYNRTYQHQYRIRAEQKYLKIREAVKTRADAVKVGELRSIFAKAEKLCVYCGRPSKRLTIDHCTPISGGGSHVKDNLVPCCKSCNSSKGTKDLADWLYDKHGKLGLARAVVFLERERIDPTFYPLKRKMMRAFNGIEIEVVR